MVSAQTPLIDGDKFILTFPSTITLPTLASDISCAAETTVTAVACSKASQTITVTFTTFSGGTVASGSQFSFLINNLQNPISLKPTSTITVSATDSAGATVNSYAGSLIITNTATATITSATLSQDSQIAGAVTNYQITFTTINKIPADGIVQLIYPSAISISSSTVCTGISNIQTSLDCTDHNTVVRKILIKNGFTAEVAAGTEIRFSFSLVTNPTTANTASIELSTTTSDDYKIDEKTSDLIPSLECNFPCKTCPSTNKDQCTSCFTDGSTTLAYLHQNQCLEECPSGYAHNGGNECVACSSNCLTCSASDNTACLTCNTATTFTLLYNSKCYETCIAGTYQNIDVCVDCPLPCGNCDSPSVCTSCSQSTSNSLKNFYNSACIASCPDGTTSIAGFC